MTKENDNEMKTLVNVNKGKQGKTSVHAKEKEFQPYRRNGRMRLMLMRSVTYGLRRIDTVPLT